MDEELQLLKKLDALRDKHRHLDEQIRELSANVHLNQLAIMRFKKEKLLLRDQIAYIERMLYPDIVA